MLVKRLSALVVALGLLGAVIPATALAAGSSYWNVAGTYGVNVTVTGDSNNYPETLNLTQAGTGTITGANLGPPCTGAALGCSTFTITSGSVVDNNITIVATSPWLLTMTGTIAADGSMAGIWWDSINRTGTWSTTSGFATSINTNSHEKTDLLTQITPGNNGPAVGAVIFNSSAGTPNNLEMTVQLKKVLPNTTYAVYLFLDGSSLGVVGTLTTNGVGNATFHVNWAVSPGIHSVAVDVAVPVTGADTYVTTGLYGQNLFMYFQ